MTASIQSPKPKNINLPAVNSSPRAAGDSTGRHAPGRFTFAALLAGLLLLLASVPAARADQQPPGCNGSGLGITLFTSSPDVHIGDTLFYSINVFNGVPGSGRTVCDATEIQASIVTPDGVSHPIALRRTTLHNAEGDFYPDVVSYVVRAQDILPDGTVRATASDTGVIHQNDTNSQGGGNQGVNTEVSLPCIALTVQCVGGVGENGLITFTGTVTNCGNNTLVGVTVTNFVNGGQFHVTFITNLLKGQIANFSGSWIPLNPCSPSTATFTAQGIDQFTTAPRTVTSSASTTCQNALTPGILVTKVCPTQPVAPGQLLTFSGSVSNTGNVTLTNIVVVNSQPTANTTVFTLPSLAPGAVANFNGSYLAPTNCSVADTLTATAASRCGVGVSSVASATCPILTTPQIAVTVLCPPNPAGAGGTLTYSGTVRNTGDITLNNIVVVSDRPAPNTQVFTVASLAPGASANFTSSLTVPANACTVTTTFSGRGTGACAANTVTNTVSATCSIATAPAIAVTLACPATPAATGGLITYTGTVRNSGNVTLNNVTVVNSQSIPSTVFTVASLAPGASANFTASFTAPLDACAVTSTVTGSGTDNCTGNLVNNSASATCALVTTPRIVVTQSCPVTPPSLGGVLTYSGTVSNAGNITLTNVVITNDRTGTTPVFTVATLAPGALTSFTGSYTVPANNPCSITSTLTANGSSICGIAVAHTASATCTILTAPAIVVTQTCPSTPVLQGGLLTYSGTVSNAGNTTLTNIIVVNNQPATNTVVFTAASLAPGATANFTGSYQVPTNCCVVSSTVRGSGQGCDGTTVTSTATRTCTVLTEPRIVVTKICRPGVLRPGDLLTYSGIVSNAGNISLFEVTVVNNQSQENSPLLGPISLAPGESFNYTASYIVPPDFCGTDTVTARGLDSCSFVPVTHSVTTTCPVTTTPRIAVTKNCPLLPTPRGGLYTFTGSVSNAGNVALVNVFVVDNQPSNNTPVIGPLTLAPGESANFTGSYIAPHCCCFIIDTLTARGQDRCSGSNVTATATALCPLLTSPSITVVQNCPPNPIPMGSVYAFSGYVTNTGDVVLTNVFVFGPQGNNTPVLGPIELAPRESEFYSGSYTVPFNTCAVSVTAVGHGVCSGNTVINTASCPVATTPLLAVTQNCPPNAVSPGGLFTYSGTVRNAGNITLTNVVVTDDRNGPRAITTTTFWVDDQLPAGAVPVAEGGDSWDFISSSNPAPFSGAKTHQSGIGAGVHQHFFTSATDTLPINAGDILVAYVYLDPLNVPSELMLQWIAGPAISRAYWGANLIGFGTDGTAARRYMGPLPAAGQWVRLEVPASLVGFENRVLNGMAFTLFGGRATWDAAGKSSTAPASPTQVFAVAALAPGETVSFTGSYLAPTNCFATTISTATGWSICGVAVTNKASVTCPILTTPQITVTAVCPATPVVPGGSLTYSGTVRNSGNTTLTNVVVVSDRPAPNTTVFSVPTLALAPGASANFTATYAVPANACAVTTTFSGSGKDICTPATVTNTVSTTCPVTTAPAVAVTLACPAVPANSGGSITYSGTVRNSGNVTLNNVFVVNNQPAPNTPVIGPLTLAPGASNNFTTSFTAPNACSVTSVVTATGSDNCTAALVSNSASANCTLTTTPGIVITQLCPVSPMSPGGLFTYSGSVSNAGNITLTNVVVLNNLSGLSPIFTAATLAPGAVGNFTGSYVAPTNCFTASTSITTGRSVCGIAVTNTVSVNCPVTTTPGISITETCPPGPVSAGSSVVFGGLVSNSGNITLTNVLVFSSQPSNNTPVLGPITLAPGGSAPFTGSYIATGGSNPTTNSTIVTNSSSVITTNVSSVIITNSSGTITTNIVSVVTTNSSGTITTNSVTPTFGTINPVTGALADRFNVPSGLHGLMFADQDQNWGATLFYSTRHPASGADFLATISTIPPAVGVVTDRFALSSTGYDALTLSAPDVGYGAVNFYYVRHDNVGATTFGVIKAAGASSSSDLWPIPNTGYTGLAFAAANVGGYGANMFYYVRQGVAGLSTFGTINPTPGGIATDRYTVGNNLDALVFVPGAVSTWGTAIFAYLRHDTTGSIIGSIDPVTHVATDRLNLGTNFLTALTFTATDVGYGPNLFYYLRPESTVLTTNNVTTFTTNNVTTFTTNNVTTFTTNTVTTFATNTVSTFTTNSVVSFTPTNTVRAVGMDICQGRTVTAAADCSGSIVAPPPTQVPVVPTMANGLFRLSFPTQTGKSYTVQYKSALNDPIWTDLETVVGTGGNMTITDALAAQRPTRFYRVLSSP